MELRLVAVQLRAYKVTTVRGEGDIYPSDLIARDFTSSVPGMRFVGDITYLRTTEGRLYLATVIDLATRMVVGWCTDDDVSTPLVEKALAMARVHAHVKPHAVFHSDRGGHNTHHQVFRSTTPQLMSRRAWERQGSAGSTLSRNTFKCFTTGNELAAASDISHPVRNFKNFRPPRWRPETRKTNPEFVQRP